MKNTQSGAAGGRGKGGAVVEMAAVAMVTVEKATVAAVEMVAAVETMAAVATVRRR